MALIYLFPGGDENRSFDVCFWAAGNLQNIRGFGCKDNRNKLQ